MEQNVVFEFNLYILLLLISTGASFGLAVFAWVNRRRVLINGVFAGLMLSLSVWSLFQTLEWVFVDPGMKLRLVNLQYVAMLTAVALWFVLALVYSGREHWLTTRNLALLSIEPILVLFLIWTNPLWGLFKTRVWVEAGSPTGALMYEYGPGFWLHATYSYILLLLGTIFILQAVTHMSGPFNRQSTIITIGILVPWFFNFYYLLGFSQVDLTPVGFTFSGLVLAWGLFSFQLLDIVPIARTTVFESLQDAILTLDNRNRVIDLNPAAKAIFGVSDHDIIGQPAQRFFATAPNLFAQLDSQTAQQLEVNLKLADGPACFDLQLSPIVNGRGVHVGCVILLRDITARKLTEAAEREQRALAEALRDVAVTLNNSLDITEVLAQILAELGRVLPHDTASVMLLQGDVAYFQGHRGFSGQQLQGIHRAWPVATTPNLQHMLESGRPVIIGDVREDSRWIVSPEMSWIRAYIGVPILHKGTVIGFINLDSASPHAYREEDGEKLQAFANQAAIALGNAQLFTELAERNAELDAYARTIAHDLKAPLDLIYGYAELLADLDLPPTGRAYLDVMQTTIDRMERMIEQLLLLAQLRDVAQTAVPLDVRPLIYAALDRFHTRLEAQNVKVHLADKLLPVLGHAPWLEELFANLFSNAVKYSGVENLEPTITIRALADGRVVRYEVSDNGLGIDPAHQDQIFDMFTRFHREEAAGTGLGLSIVRRIVEKLGGQVGVSSAPGQGSTFWFTLPAAPTPISPQLQTTSPPPD